LEGDRQATPEKECKIKREAGRLHGARGPASRVIFRKVKQAEPELFLGAKDEADTRSCRLVSAPKDRIKSRTDVSSTEDT
jgi:hypothetical protein